MRLEYKLLIGFGTFVVLVLIGGGIFVTSMLGSSSKNFDQKQDGLSGQLVALDPNRAMAGAPCHYMGGGYMGDCAVREIAFEARQWDWSEPSITVRSGELVRLKATSKDVTHGMAIPQINFNMRIEPGKTTVGEFMAPAPGTYDYGCSVMCGSGHHNHRGKLVVVA